MTEQPLPPDTRNEIRKAEAHDPSAPSGWFARFLATVEWLGNCLPHPVTLFFLFGLGVAILSGVPDLLNWIEGVTGIKVGFDPAVEDPRPEGARGRADDGMIRMVSLASGDGVRWIVENLVTNFTGFKPLGTVLVALLGVGVAERSGLLGALIRGMVLAAPKNLVTVVIVFAGVLSNTASEMGYVVLIPLAATIYHALGRHPLAGLAAAYAGVSGGYSANLLIGTVDPLLAGITQEAARMAPIEGVETYEVHAAVNWYFMMASTFLITIVGSWVSLKIVEPRLGKYDDSNADESIERDPSLDALSKVEKRGLKRAGVAALLTSLLFVYLAGPALNAKIETRDPSRSIESLVDHWNEHRLGATEFRQRLEQEELDAGLGNSLKRTFVIPRQNGWGGSLNRAMDAWLPGYGVLRNPDTGSLMPSSFLRGIVALIFIFFVVPGFVYGRATGTMKNDRDIIDAMAHAMGTMGLYIVLVFFAAQFVAFFNYTNMGSILAVLGADLLVAMRLDNPLVFLPFILMCCFVNLMLGSASAQWAVTAPIFVPMLMTIGYSPEVIQAAYRIGDSTTNTVTPMMSYFGLILAFGARFDKKLGIGTLIATMLPYCLVFLAGWIVLFYAWVFLFGLPVGPGAPTHFPPPAG